MNYYYRVLASLAIIVGLGACSEKPAELVAPEQEQGQDLTDVENAIHAAADYLVQQVNEDGMFVYRINMNPSVPVEPKYNILRHAGTIYALTMYQERFPNPGAMNAIEKTVGYLRTKAMAPLDKEKKLLGVWSIPKVNNASPLLQAKLGGNGLGLVALCSYEKLKPGTIPLEDLQALGRFILYMQKEDGSFYSKFIPKQGGRNDEWVSLYYPGEAALGLVMLYELDPQSAWLMGASKALNYLAQTRKNESVVPADHWALLATERLFRVEAELPVSKNLLIHHAKQIANVMLASQIYAPGRPELHGAFTPDGRTTPASTRMEGLLAAHEFIPEELPIHAYIAAAVPLAIEFLLNAQVSEGKYKGAYPRSLLLLSGDSEEAAIANARSTEVRIDYVQHALSALLQYHDIVSK